jgi:hypothetical protein
MISRLSFSGARAQDENKGIAGTSVGGRMLSYAGKAVINGEGSIMAAEGNEPGDLTNRSPAFSFGSVCRLLGNQTVLLSGT